MKKILIGFALGLATLSFAQQYPNNNNGWEDDGGYYSDQDDQSYFPDDYYYNYPQDYYPQQYYQSNYDEYRNSVVNINWNVFFTQNRLAPWQIDQIMRLNNLYVNFSSWNNFYRYNPDRWYYDRFYALERIMGPRVFVVFQNNFYRGYRPVVYFQNYRRTHYAAIYRPMPRYRNVNINIYRVDRGNFRRNDNPTFNIVRNGNTYNGGFRNSSNNRSNSGNFRNDRTNNGGFRNGSETPRRENNGGFRNDRADNSGGFRNNSEAPKRENNGGFRSNNGGFRNEVRREEPKRTENNGFRNNNGGGFRQRSESSAPRQENRGNGNENRGGFRNKLANN